MNRRSAIQRALLGFAAAPLAVKGAALAVKPDLCATEVGLCHTPPPAARFAGNAMNSAFYEMFFLGKSVEDVDLPVEVDYGATIQYIREDYPMRDIIEAKLKKANLL